jgi:hypothetical protein
MRAWPSGGKCEIGVIERRGAFVNEYNGCRNGEACSDKNACCATE